MENDLTPLQRLEKAVEEFEENGDFDLPRLLPPFLSVAAESAAMKQGGARYAECETRDAAYASLLRRFKKAMVAALNEEAEEIHGEADFKTFEDLAYALREHFEQAKGHLLPHAEDFPRSVEALSRLIEDVEAAYAYAARSLRPEEETEEGGEEMDQARRRPLSKGMKIALAVGSLLLGAGIVFLIFYLTR